MSTIREKREKVSSLIKSNNLDGLKNYVEIEHIDLKLMNKKNFDSLIWAIECNVSPQMINYIICNCKYKSLNYYIYKRFKGNISPLSCAILEKNFEVANLLLNKKADINFKIENDDLFFFLFSKNQLDIENLKFLLNHNINVPSSHFINMLIEAGNNSITEVILKHYNFDIVSILNLLNFYKYKVPLTIPQLRKAIERIEFNESMYESAVSKDNYEALELLFKFDLRDEHKRSKNLFKILNNENNMYKKDSIVDAIKNKRIKLSLDKHFIDNLSTIEQKRNVIMDMIKEDKVMELNSFIKENKFSLSYFNNKTMDILMFALNHKASYEMIKLIIRYNPYENLNYTVGFSDTPLLSAISNNRFDVADLLIQHGSNINYVVSFERIIYYLYFRKLNPQLLKYLLKRGAELSYNTFDLMQKLIESSQNDLIETIFKFLIYDNNFILSFLNIYHHRIALSYQQLKKVIWKEKSKFKIKNNWYATAINKKNYEALKILTCYDSRKNFNALKILSEYQS
jgi:ankyrin repeat protein